MNCWMNPVINDKIRIIYEMPVRDPNYGATYINTSPDQGKRPESVSLKDRQQVTFVKKSNFYAQLISNYDTSLNGLKSFSIFFKSDDLVNPNLYQNWTFQGEKGAKDWDSPLPEDKSFWYAKNTTLLFYT